MHSSVESPATSASRISHTTALDSIGLHITIVHRASELRLLRLAPHHTFHQHHHSFSHLFGAIEEARLQAPVVEVRRTEGRARILRAQLHVRVAWDAKRFWYWVADRRPARLIVMAADERVGRLGAVAVVAHTAVDGRAGAVRDACSQAALGASGACPRLQPSLVVASVEALGLGCMRRLALRVVIVLMRARVPCRAACLTAPPQTAALFERLLAVTHRPRWRWAGARGLALRILIILPVAREACWAACLAAPPVASALLESLVTIAGRRRRRGRGRRARILALRVLIILRDARLTCRAACLAAPPLAAALLERLAVTRRR